jgi:hypothetical protein
MKSGEFLRWKAFLDWEIDSAFHRQDYYLAQIAAEIRMGHVQNPGRVKIQDFLIRFTRPEKQSEVLTEEQKKNRLAKSKAMWCGLAKAKY